MEFVHHPTNNHVFGPPIDYDHTIVPCGALPVTICMVDGRQEIQSYWRPNAEELAAINRGNPIVLVVLGQQHPVVSLAVEA